MKTIYIIIIAAFVALVFTGCKKEELPPYRCNNLRFSFWAFAPTPPIDSMFVSIEQVGAEDGKGNRLDTVIYNPAAGFELPFCGVFKYKARIYNSNPIYFVMAVRIKSDIITYVTLTDNGTVEDEFMYDGLPY